MPVIDDVKFLVVAAMVKVPGWRILRIVSACRAKGVRVDRMVLQSTHMAGGRIDEVAAVLLHCASKQLGCDIHDVCANDLLGIPAITMMTRIDDLNHAHEGLMAVRRERIQRGAP